MAAVSGLLKPSSKNSSNGLGGFLKGWFNVLEGLSHGIDIETVQLCYLLICSTRSTITG
jgi:hypothetical protein